MSSGFRTRAGQGNARLRLVCLVVCFFFAALPVWAQDREEEIVANLAGGRVIMHVARDTIIFAAIDQPVEPHAIPPRVVGIDSGHIGVLFGASEWRSPADPKPIRLDRSYQRVGATGARGDLGPAEAEPEDRKRSEERRVGKECRARGSPDREKKKGTGGEGQCVCR